MKYSQCQMNPFWLVCGQFKEDIYQIKLLSIVILEWNEQGKTIDFVAVAETLKYGL